jgi:hypothetical protein
MRIVLIVLGMAVAVGSTGISDRYHMSQCLPAARNFAPRMASSGEDEIATLLFLMRACYFHHPRELGDYDLPYLTSNLIKAVPAFTQKEYDLMNDIIAEDIRLMDELLLNSNDQSLEISLLQLLLAFVVVWLAMMAMQRLDLIKVSVTASKKK